MFDRFVSWLNLHGVLTPRQFIFSKWIRFIDSHSKYELCEMLYHFTVSLFLFFILFIVLFFALLQVSSLFYNMK